MNGLYNLADVHPSELRALVARALELRRGAGAKRFQGKALGLLFLSPSLRTQASFQRAAGKLGLELVHLSGAGIWQVEVRDGVVMDGIAAEHVREAAAVLGRYVDVLAVRAFATHRSLAEDLADPVVRSFQRHAGVPVINMESALWHPCQALADWTTLDQLGVPSDGKFVLSWAWHPRGLPHAVPNSTLCMAAQRGMEVVLHCPEGYELHEDVMSLADELGARSGASITTVHDRELALDGAHVIYAKSWGALDTWGDAEAEATRRADYRDAWCVQPDWLGENTRFFHCLPVRRNVVVADAVLNGPASAVLEQAENRLHAQTALLESILGSKDSGKTTEQSR